MIKRFIVTGAPSTGKSSLINELSNMGYECFNEISRSIIKKENIEKINKDLNFEMQIFKMRKKQYKLANMLHFYDRSIVDILAYMNISKIKPPKQILDFLKNNKYEQNVFILKPWKEIYKKDNQRFEEFKHAEIINSNLEKVYKNLNYNLIDIPKISIKQRAKFVISKI